MNISEKILQYLKKYDVGDDVKIKLASNEKEKSVGGKNTVETVASEVSANETDSQNDKKKQLLDKLTVLNRQLEGIKEPPTLEMMEYTPLSEEEIAKKASEGLEESYGLKFNDLENQTLKKIDAIEKNSDLMTAKAGEQKEKLQSLYKDAEEKLEQSAIKRGVSRSSIVSEQLKNLSVEKIKDELNIDYNLASELKNNSDKIVELESDYLNAVNKLNVEKALELSERIQDLTDKQNDKIEEVLKYNNTIKRQLKSFENDKVVPPTEKEKTKIKQNMLQEALNYYLSIPKEEALKRFESDYDVKYVLGDLADVLANYIKATN